MNMAMTRITVDAKLWSRFQAGRIGREQIEAHPTLSRWDRCVRLGVRPEGPLEPRLASTAHVRVPTHPMAPLLEMDSPFEAFAASMTSAGFCALLADSDGVVVSRHTGPRFERTLVARNVVEGACWSEAARGTNGIGTALAENTAVAIVGHEHFEQHNHVLACYAAPVRDARRRLVAILDASGPAKEAAPFALASVRAAAAAMEALLVARTYDDLVPGGLRSLERLLASLPHAALLLESTGKARRANDRLRALFPQWRKADLCELLQRNEPPIERSAPGHPPFEQTIPTLSGFRVEIEPVGDPDDSFAAIAHLLPRGSRRSIRMPSPAMPSALLEIVGSDPAIREARELAARFTETRVPMLLLAESGTGRQAFARAVHLSGRASGPFEVLHCGALSEPPRGTAPAGAELLSRHITAADGGTLFLDEIADLPPPAQALLLQLVETGNGSVASEEAERRLDVRVIATTRHDPAACVATGNLREDLLYLLRGVVVRLPALRDRTDRRELVEALLIRVAAADGRTKPLGVSADAMKWVARYDWPGNIRELRSAIEHAVVLAGDAPRIERWHLPVEESDASEGSPSDLRSNVERAAVSRALMQANGNLSQAARRLGVARSTLYRMIVRHGLRATDEPLPI